MHWDGRDAAGERVAPGVYYYRAALHSGVAGGKVVLVH